MDERPAPHLMVAAVEEETIGEAIERLEPVVSVGIIHCDAPLTKIVAIDGINREVDSHEDISDQRELLCMTTYVARFLMNCRQKKALSKTLWGN